ncbi:MAG: zinc-dependent metalloprotease family protein [Myxococcota bacterium]
MANRTTNATLLTLLAWSVGCYVGLPDGAGVDAGTDGFADSGDDDEDDDGGASGGSADGGGPGSGGDPSGGSSGADDGGDSPTGGDGTNPTTDPSGDDDDGGDETGSEETGSDVEPPPDSELARDIAWSSIEMNQGVVIEVVRDGSYLSPTQRNADLIAGRPTLVRGFWTLGSGFTPRELEGRLIVSSGGSEDIYTDVRSVSGAPDPTSLDGGFLWEVPAGVIDQGSSFAFEIVETDDSLPGAAANDGARVPADGFEQAGTATGAHVLEVVVVPLRYNAGGGLTPDLSQANRTILENALYDQNPITQLDISYRQVVDYGGAVNSGNQLGDILGFLSQLKSQDGAAPGVYYAGLVNIGCFVTGCGNAGTTGIAYVPGASQNSSFQRVSANVWFQPESSSGTVVHEIGHNQGLNHVFCPGGGASGTDPAYPYNNGQLSGWGWGAKSGDIYGSNSYDYMSYCGPSWVSDWTWEKTRARIETLSAWSAAPPAPDTTLVLGHAYPDGSQSWFALHGERLDPDQSSSTISFELDGAASITVDAVEGDLSDDGGRWVVAEVPTEALDFRALVWRHDGVVETVASSAIAR